MSDLISRQQAISRAVELRMFDRPVKMVAVSELERLPSAQPEQRWIPCSEGMPESLQEVLVTSTHGHVYTSRIVHGDFEYGGNVLAWMPLPEPYKGGEKS